MEVAPVEIKTEKPCCNRDCCQQGWNWSVQICLWGFIIYIGISGGMKHYLDIWEIVVISILYAVYLINFFCYKSCCFLSNRHEKSTIYTYMQKMFYTPAHINFHVECYHYETRHFTTTDSKGNVRQYTRTEKVVSHRESERFMYYSWRDTSGTLMIDSQNAKNDNKAYVKLELALRVEFADDITRLDYNVQKKNQYMRNRFRDRHISQWETTTLQDFNQFNLVNISDDEPVCISVWWYVLFTIIPVVMLYDLYFNYWCVAKDYTLKKTVSSRYNLMAPEHDNRFISSIPRILFNDDEKLYNEAPQPLHDTPQLPNENELMHAAEFVRQQTINPNYQLEDFNKTYNDAIKYEGYQNYSDNVHPSALNEENNKNRNNIEPERINVTQRNESGNLNGENVNQNNQNMGYPSSPAGVQIELEHLNEKNNPGDANIEVKS